MTEAHASGVVVQSPHAPAFLQEPYPFYDTARAAGPVIYWQDYGMLAAFDHATVYRLLRDRRLGRAWPRAAAAEHLADFEAVEQHSLLELEPPDHTRLRKLVLHAFTSRRIGNLTPDIHVICAELLKDLPADEVDLIPHYCQLVPVRVIARLLGVPEAMAPDLLRWSTDMVAMYQAGRTHAVETRANTAAREFSEFLRDYIARRRSDPRDDLITELIAATDDGQTLSPDEMISTCILLLNAGHEATVHAMGNAVKTMLEHGAQNATQPQSIEALVEETLRFDPPLHMFTRYAYEPVQLGDVYLKPGDQIALMLGSAGRDPDVFPDPHRFDPMRAKSNHVAFGGGLHFCVGAPLARLELQIALPALFNAYPALALAEPPQYSDSYHFHKLDRLHVSLACFGAQSR